MAPPWRLASDDGDGEAEAGAAVALGELVADLLERPAELLQRLRGMPMPVSATEKVIGGAGACARAP